MVIVMATAAERSKAYRLRKKGDDATPEERAWLADYDARDTAPRDTPSAPVAPPSQPLPGDAPAPAAPTPDPATWVDLPTSPSPTESTALAPAVSARCTVENCPACKNQSIDKPTICATTGKPVYPPISESAARMIAGAIFWLVGIAAKLLRKSAEITEPTKLEKDELARAVREIVRRRAGFVVAFDDLLTAGFALGSYGRRALAAPRKEPEVSP
jgi:hypothetical protein